MIVLGIAIGIIVLQFNQNSNLKNQVDIYKTNTLTLLDSVRIYRTSDSLNAAEIGVLRIEARDFEKFRSSDAALIKTLQVKNRDLANVTNAQTRTINNIKGQFKPKIVYIKGDTVESSVKADTVYCLEIRGKWFDLIGCSDRLGNFSGTHVSRDSLLIATTVKYKRFLGFLWKTNKIKDRKVDIVSKNPDTQITGFEFIEIVK